MKKKIVFFMLIIIVILSYGVYWAFFDIGRLPKGELISEAISPNGEYTVKAYVSDGGATTDFAVLGVLKYNTKDKKSKNIYWNYHEDTANIKWVDNDTVIFNGKQLNVLHDTFDYRRGK